MRTISQFIFAIPCLLISIGQLNAQGPIAGFAVPKGEVAIAINYASEQYDTYLNPEGNENRELTALSYSLFVEAGLSDEMAVVASIPYIETNEDNSSLQDASLFLKYRNLESRSGQGRHWIHTAIGATFPIGNYPTDGEAAIGQRAFVFQGRLVYQYQHDQGWFVSALSGIDFQLSPDSRAVWPVLFRAGYGAPWLYIEGWLEFVNALDGTQGTETALAGTGSSWTRTGATVYFPVQPWFGVQVNGAWILDGEFIGQSTRLGGGVVFKF
ncbi:MAG: transporter [Bacteroidota bacterium]